MTLEELLQDSHCLQNFKLYLISEFAHENLLFYLETRRFQKLDDPKEAQQKAEQIFDKYLPTQGSDSDEEINLNGQVLKRLRDKQVCQVYDSNTFSEAQDEIYELLLYDCFPRYIRSTAYVEFMEERDQILASILISENAALAFQNFIRQSDRQNVSFLRDVIEYRKESKERTPEAVKKAGEEIIKKYVSPRLKIDLPKHLLDSLAKKHSIDLPFDKRIFDPAFSYVFSYLNCQHLTDFLNWDECYAKRKFKKNPFKHYPKTVADFLQIEQKKEEDSLKQSFWNNHFSADSFHNSMKDVFAKSISLETAGTSEFKFNGIPSLVFSFLFNGITGLSTTKTGLIDQTQVILDSKEHIKEVFGHTWKNRETNICIRHVTAIYHEKESVLTLRVKSESIDAAVDMFF